VAGPMLRNLSPGNGSAGACAAGAAGTGFCWAWAWIPINATATNTAVKGRRAKPGELTLMQLLQKAKAGNVPQRRNYRPKGTCVYRL